VLKNTKKMRFPKHCRRVPKFFILGLGDLRIINLHIIETKLLNSQYSLGNNLLLHWQRR